MSAIIENNEFTYREDPGDPWVGKFHHIDLYPAGDGSEEVKDEDLEGHTLGEDLGQDLDFRLYYGGKRPGFPVHSHRGFETVTIVLDGFVDHHDSKGEAGRYGAGDVQWMTAGKGIRHTEMFPLVHSDKENRTELFQLWLSLPSWNKMVEPDYKMLWREEIPVIEKEGSRVKVIIGKYEEQEGPKPTEGSWAYDDRSHFRILLIEIEPGAKVLIDGVTPSLNRNLYPFEGDFVMVDGERVEGKRHLKMDGEADFVIEAGREPAKLLLLEAEPLNEPIINDGPMIMNTQEEVLQGYRDFWKNQYGEWPWKERDPLHPVGTGRVSSKEKNPEDL